jgi:hypothetical protein
MHPGDAVLCFYIYSGLLAGALFAAEAHLDGITRRHIIQQKYQEIVATP